MKRRCLRRAAAKDGRKKGRCIKWARPTHAKKSEVPKTLKPIARKERKRLTKGKCLKWSKSGGTRRCLLRSKPINPGRSE